MVSADALREEVELGIPPEEVELDGLRAGVELGNPRKRVELGILRDEYIEFWRQKLAQGEQT